MVEKGERRKTIVIIGDSKSRLAFAAHRPPHAQARKKIPRAEIIGGARWNRVAREHRQRVSLAVTFRGRQSGFNIWRRTAAAAPGERMFTVGNGSKVAARAAAFTS